MRVADIDDASNHDELNRNDAVVQKYVPGKKLAWVLKALDNATNCAASVYMPDKHEIKIGDKSSDSEFEIHLNNNKAVTALVSLDELALAEAYIKGDIEILGNFMKVLDLRHAISDNHPLLDFVRRIKPKVFGQVKDDRNAIQEHYEFDDDFYMVILDETRTYSQGVYESDDESLETAMIRKLDYVIESCKLTKGSKVLDVGGGWGAFNEYAGKKGIEVTSLTIADHSEEYLSRLIKENNLPCHVIKKNFLEFEPEEKFDAIVVLGVIEHMPYYDKVVKKLENLLKPGGYAYFDGSASTKKFEFNAFLNRYIYPGNHCTLSIHDFLAEVQKSDMELLTVHTDRHSYYLTCKAWAEKMEANRNLIIDRWGRELYAKFLLYLWGVAHNFYHNQLQAYRLVLTLNPPS
ncbi:class I SAM-dependent methyltransferase [Cocleimonas sp. KMM 6892]|uniref:class I SAM-dependent methyltransferase n=1 Tax=unclassified Cocleimonas TaxID=2639732 RepID=UPI002DBF4897|nr:MULTISPECIES: class I SAM-dependent methyltransferase [unclassified Cocleimonas]MEB8433150.1 class I SAM-dependent methyltransferase [Cocleimonas sp. KMM 6892]MEC4715869.1 class I SAM-dependent methyltransferase [Cocleimonas sp. KMM 6895]MEC4745330.1 class I SAM-dependent methyltransferase [Cocleimonas sp. KMM 6896]